MAPIDIDAALETLWDALLPYVSAQLDAQVDAAVGSDTTSFYDLRAGFPGDKEQRDMMPLTKPLIHFEIDDIEEVRIGIGDQIVETDTASVPAGTDVSNYEAQRHHVNIDVGIWTTDDTGGERAVRAARQRLGAIFNGSAARRAIRPEVGVQVISFSGGRTVRDTINEQVVYRGVDMELILLVFSRHLAEVAPMADIILSPSLELDGVDIEETLTIDTTP